MAKRLGKPQRRRIERQSEAIDFYHSPQSRFLTLRVSVPARDLKRIHGHGWQAERIRFNEQRDE
jgi:hypothetical protein